MRFTVGDLKKELEKFEDDERVVISVRSSKCSLVNVFPAVIANKHRETRDNCAILGGNWTVIEKEKGISNEENIRVII